MIRAAHISMLIIALAVLASAEGATRAQPGYSAPALYNLANAYARAGKPGMAVLNYERASLLDPADPDIRANLHFVREASGVPPAPQNWLDRLAGIAAPRAFAWVGLAGLLMAGMGALAGQLSLRHRRKFRAVTFIGILLVGATACNAMALWPRMREGVVIAREAPVRVSPATIGEPVFALREAEIVRMSAEHEGFVLVQTGAGRTGWVARSNLEPIVQER